MTPDRPARRRAALALAAALATAPGVAPAQERVALIAAPDAQTQVTLVMRSTTGIDVLQPVIEAFVATSPRIAVRYEQWGSNALFEDSLAACAGQSPLADAVFSSGVHQMIDLVNRACAGPYRSERTNALPAARRWRDELWGITKEPVVIIYNTDLVPEADAPTTRFALLDLMRRPGSAYNGKIATYDIQASGLGYLLAFMDSLEATTFGALLEGFARTGAVATCCSSEIIRSVSDGQYLIAYNVLGSYVDDASLSNIAVILPQDYTLFLSRAYMIPKGARHKAEAAQLLDFMLSAQGQSHLAARNLFYTQSTDASPLPQSAERSIAIQPTLLVAGDQHRRARFSALWRSAFAQHPGAR
jgi:ABC-type Fe3+ transport system substrate-binding protein